MQIKCFRSARAVGTTSEQASATYTYNLDGQRRSLSEANRNRAEMTYDGHGDYGASLLNALISRG